MSQCDSRNCILASFGSFRVLYFVIFLKVIHVILLQECLCNILCSAVHIVFNIMALANLETLNKPSFTTPLSANSMQVIVSITASK